MNPPTETPRPRSLNLVIQDALLHRLKWASVHWRTESVDREAWPHLADAVADAVKPLVDKAIADALNEAADAWQQGAWTDTPRHHDRVADRIGAAQFFGDWLRARAQTRVTPPAGQGNADA